MTKTLYVSKQLDPYLANRSDVRDRYRDGPFTNTLGGIGLISVVLIVLRVVRRIVPRVI